MERRVRMKTCLTGLAWAGALVLFGSGLYAHRQARQALKEHAQHDAVDRVRSYAPTLIKGLVGSQVRASREEAEAMALLWRDPRVLSIVYLNKYGEVRWFKDSSKIGLKFEEFNREFPFKTNSVEEAWLRKQHQFRSVPGEPTYDLSVPLTLRDQVIGLVNLRVNL